jgi:hypothetical protein
LNRQLQLSHEKSEIATAPSHKASVFAEATPDKSDPREDKKRAVITTDYHVNNTIVFETPMIYNGFD